MLRFTFFVTLVMSAAAAGYLAEASFDLADEKQLAHEIVRNVSAAFLPGWFSQAPREPEYVAEQAESDDQEGPGFFSFVKRAFGFDRSEEAE